MKKKIVKLLIAGLCCLMIFGCGAVTDGPETEDEDIVEEDDDDDEDEPEDPDEPEESVSDEEYILIAGYGSENYCVVDGEGNVLYEIDSKAVQESLGDIDEEKYRLAKDSTGCNADPDSAGGGFIFFDDFLCDEDYIFHPIAFALGGLESGNYKLYPLWEGSADQRIRSVDWYKGALHLDIENYDDSGYSELVFSYDEKTDSFTCEEDTELDAVFEKAVSTGLSIEGQTSEKGTLTYCYRRTLDDCGFIFARGDEFLAAIDASGKVQKRIDIGSRYYSFCYDAAHLFYIDSDYTNHLYTVRVKDVKNDTETQIGETIYSTQLTGATLLSGDSGKYCYATYEYDEFGIRVHRVYSYDAFDGSNTFLYEERSIPGSTIVPATEMFTVAGDYAYYLGFDDGDIIWMRKKISDDSAPEKTGIVLSHVDVFDLGTVSYRSNTYVCPDCGTDLIMKYCECFILDDKYSEHSAEINAFLEQEAVRTVDWETDYYESSCADHSERPTSFQVTYSLKVDSAFIIDGRYLAVDMSGFWYGGGSAGYYPRKQYMFDLKTGEDLSIKDFYTGTEKEFTELVAQKTVEDFLSFDEYSSPYYGSNEDEVRSDAKSFISFDGFIRFTEDGIYYCYLPDQIAVVQVDYIEIFIPYEELLGRETLAE